MGKVQTLLPSLESAAIKYRKNFFLLLKAGPVPDLVPRVVLNTDASNLRYTDKVGDIEHIPTRMQLGLGPQVWALEDDDGSDAVHDVYVFRR